MTDLAKLVVRLEAETARYQSELDKAKRQLGGFESGVNASLKRIGTAVGAATLAAAAGFAAMIKGSLDTADKMSKLAQSTGLSTEAISQLQYAADLSGVENLGGSLLKFNRAIGEAASGTKAQADAFKAIGVNLRDADGNLKSTEQLLLETADAFSKHADGAAKTAIAMDLFGESGGALIPLLNSGRDGIAAMREEADRLGVTIDSNTGKAAEAFNDNVTRLQKSVQGLATMAAARLAPSLQVMSDRVVNVVTNSDALKAAMSGLEIVFKTTVSAVAIAAEVFSYVGRAIGVTAAAIVLAAQGEFRAAWAAIQDGAADARESAGALGQTIFELWNETETFSAKADEAGKKAAPAFEVVAASAGKAAAKVAELDDQAKQLIATEERMRDEGSRLAESLRTPLEQYQDRVARLNELIANHAISSDTYGRALQKYAEDLDAAYAQAGGTVAESADQFNELNTFADQAARNMQDAFADFLFDPFKDGVDGMLKSFASTLQRMAAEAAAAQIFKSIGLGESGADGGNWLTALFGSFGGQRANGGPVATGKAYLVGERGAEMFVPNTSGSIVASDDLGAFAPTINNQITIQAPAGSISPATQQQLMTRVALATQRALQRNA